MSNMKKSLFIIMVGLAGLFTTSCNEELLEIPSRIDHQNDLISKCEDDIGYCTEWRKANPPVTENKLKK